MLFISRTTDLVQERFYKFYKFTNRDRLNGEPGAENKRFKIIGLKIAGIFFSQDLCNVALARANNARTSMATRFIFPGNLLFIEAWPGWAIPARSWKRVIYPPVFPSLVSISLGFAPWLYNL